MKIQEWLGEDNKLGQDIWQNKYQYNDETFDEWLDRVANNDDELRQLIVDKKFLFGGRILANRGLQHQGKKVTFSNCYVLKKPDDSIESIFETAKNLARTFSYGGGVGFNLSNLSPRGAKINNTAKETSGAVSFMELYSKVTELIGQNGRRGALMLSIDSSHPDLEEFIELKSDLTKVTSANISIQVDDDFMKCVVEEKPYTLYFKREETGEEIIKIVDANKIFRRFAEMNHDYAEPGILFWDRVKSWTLLSDYDDFEFAGVNPCFTGDMRILTDSGYKTFKELDNSDVKIVNVDGDITDGKVWCSGEKETISLKLSDNSVIKCTPNHLFMTIDGNECMAQDLKGKKLMPLLVQKNKLDDKFIKLGFIQGDGCLSRLKSQVHKGLEVNIGYKDGDIFDLFSNEEYTNKSDRVIYLSNYTNVLHEYGFSDETLPNRTFPSKYDNWSIQEKASFLQGCYSANGCIIKNSRISYKTTCKKFAEKLTNTLEKDFGIDSYTTTNKAKKVQFENGEYECRESYDINIGRYNNIQKFHMIINFYQQYKRFQLQTLLKERTLHVRSIEIGVKQFVYDFTEPERHWGVVEGFVVHNCAEESLPAGGSCLLGSMNLVEFVDKSGNFDVDGFTKCIHISVKALNDVLDEGLPLHPLQEQRDSVRDWRQIGIGLFGLADMLIKMEIEYGSEDAIEISDIIGKLMINQSCIASSILASKEGTFPKFNLDSTKKSEFYSNLEASTKLAIEEHGMRNSQLLTIAPTGTLSTMLGISGGIEPMFATHYERRTQSIHGKDVTYKVYTPIVEQHMIDNNLTETSDLPEWFITSQELHYTKRIEMQATFQYHIDASISSTVNVPNDFTVEEVKDLYLYAHEKGLKGITIFRDGCKRTGILTPTIKDEIKTTDEPKSDLEWGSILDVNDDVVGKKRKLTTGCGTLHCTAFFDPITGNLVETYLSKGSTGGCNNFMVGLSRMMSLSARAGVEIDEIVDQLNSTGSCPSYAVRHATKHDASKGSCCPMGIGYALKEMHEEMLDDLGEGSDTFKKNNPTFKEVRVESGHTFKNSMVNPCPNVGCSGELVFQGGCNSCPVCGWSQCS